MNTLKYAHQPIKTEATACLTASIGELVTVPTCEVSLTTRLVELRNPLDALTGRTSKPEPQSTKVRGSRYQADKVLRSTRSPVIRYHQVVFIVHGFVPVVESNVIAPLRVTSKCNAPV